MRYEVQAGVGQPLATAQPCEVHRVHWTPKPTYCEEHHVIPQAWQRFASTHPAAGIQAKFAASTGLFDPRVVAVCRTGHGNIHFWLVGMMHVFDEHGMLPDPKAENVEDVVAWLGRQAQDRLEPTAGRKDLAVAKLGIVRWVQAGGSVRALCDAGQFGVI